MELRNAPDQDNLMLEAAEALAALARCSAISPSSEDQAVAAFHENKYRMATNCLISGVTDRNLANKLCSKSNRWTSASKLRQNMTEAEKEARRLCRILANRESARQTVRRRQAMHLELTRKTVDLSEENENLKKEKGLAVVEYNTLKGRNKFLKLQLANAKKAEPRETKEQRKSSLAEKHPTSATSCSPVFLYKHPSLVPFFWPSVPSSNFIHLQYLSHFDVTSLSEHSPQHRDMSSSDIGITEPVNPLFVLPLPLALPFPIYGAPLTYSDTNKRPNETPSGHQCSMSSTSDNLFVAENSELSPKPNDLMKASSCRRSMPAGNAIGTGFTYPVNSGDHHTEHRLEFTLLTPEKLSCIKPVESVWPVRDSQENNTSDPYPPPATDNVLETLPKKAEPAACRHKKPENVFAATKARRRRKEVMMLKNVKCHHTRTQTASSRVYATYDSGTCG